MKFSEIFDKNYLAKWFVSVLSGMVALGLIVYLAYHIFDIFSPELELVDAVPKTVTETISADAYIMRDEKPLYSGIASGSVAPAIHDGGRIAVGAKIADIYSVSSPDIEKRLSEIDEQITLLEGNSDASSTRSVQSTAGIENEIYENIFTIRSHCADGNYSDALSMRTTLLVNINKKLIRSGQVNYSSQIAKLESEKASLKSQLGSCLDTVYASFTGYYFSEYDGYGEVFSSDKIDSMTYDEFMKMTGSEAEKDSGLCVGAVVYDFNWYIACVMEKSSAASLMDLSSVDILFTYSDTEVSARLYRIIPQTPGDMAVAVFRCEMMPVGFDYTRMQPVKISSVEYTGYEIPSDAIRVVGGYEGVYVLDEVTIEFRRVNIVYQKDGYVICTGKGSDSTEGTNADDEIYPWIRQNDVIVVNGKDLYNGKLIR